MKLKVGMRPNKEIDDALDFIIDEIAQIAGSILDEKIKEEQGPANPNEFLFVCYQIALQVIQRFVMKIPRKMLLICTKTCLPGGEP